MRRKQMDGTNYEPALDAALVANQADMVDELTTPHSTRLNEMIGSSKKIVCSVPAYNQEAQPVQARGKIVWNKAYSFQPKGPSYLDGTNA